VASTRQLDAQIRFVAESGAWVETTLGKLDGDAVVRGAPVRAMPTYKRQRNYPGLLWTATTRSLVGYESLLERDRHWLADFDRSVTWIASQPFWVSGRDGSAIRRHVPDFLLSTLDGLVVVDVKPEALLAEPKVAEVVGWTTQALGASAESAIR